MSLPPIAAADSGSASSQFVKATAPEVVFEGRTWPTPEGTVRLGYPGILIHLRFRGDRLAVRIKAALDAEYLGISVDGAAPTVVELHKGEASVPLIADGSGREHRVEILRRTEGWQGECDILGFELGSDGSLLAPDPLPGRKLMFIGDSMTCGEESDVDPSVVEKNNRHSNGRLSFGGVLARRFRAQLHLVSCGGRGMTRDWQGIRDTTTAPFFYELAIPGDPATVWNPSQYVPDAIGICLGQNDFSSGVPDEADFVGTYVQFLDKIRRDAPKAEIFLIESAMLTDPPGRPPSKTILRDFLDEIAAKSGSPLVHAVRISHQPGRPANAHPTWVQHEAIADELEPVFRRALGW
jgi:lysophospholipase L1-like esterase